MFPVDAVPQTNALAFDIRIVPWRMSEQGLFVSHWLHVTPRDGTMVRTKAVCLRFD